MRFLLLLVISTLFIAGCDEPTVPKPKGYFRIDLPKKKYQQYMNASCPYSFEYPVYSKIQPYPGSNKTNECWLNIDFTTFRGKLHLSYFPIINDLSKHIEDSRMLAYKHTAKANAIEESLVNNPQKKVYGLVYEIEGNAASGCQFYVTDSAKHFIRGALYFSVAPNSDSIAPVQDFVKKDIEHLIQTISWR